MAWLRRSLGPIAAVWLVCQAAPFAVVPILLDASLAECVCTHGAEATCPMHHRNAAGTRVCAIQAATTSVPATLNLLFNVAGLLPALPRGIVPDSTMSPAVVERSMLKQRPSPPDPPPPRA